MNIKQLVKEIFLQIKSDWYLPVVERQVYSEQETVIGVWTDGKPLYRKAWVFENNTQIPSNSWYDTGISNTNIAAIPNASCINSTGTSSPLAASCDSGTTIKVMCYRNSGFSANAFIFEYTKTTDSPTTQSKVPFEPLTEYSTDEKMIGYWIDGKALYRKVIETTMPPNTSSVKMVPHNVSNIESIITIKGVFKQSSGAWQQLPTSLNDFSGHGKIYVADNTNIGIKINAPQWINEPLYVTLEYTKTTD